MGTYPTLLKRLVCERHWRAHPVFIREYDKAAATVDSELVGRGPSAEQWERWLAGRVKTRPRSAHCRVLEHLFPGYTIDRLLAVDDAEHPGGPGCSGGHHRSDSSHGVDCPKGLDCSDCTDCTVCAESMDCTEIDGPATAPRRQDGAGGVRWPARRPLLGAVEHEAGCRHNRDAVVGPRRMATLPLGVVAGQLADVVMSEPDELHAALEGGTVSEDRLTHLEADADYLGVQVVKVPPGELLAEAVTPFRSVRRLLRDRQRTASQIRLVRIGAKLATVVGEILFTSGHFGLARQWYVAARRAAADIGDQYLADIALAGNAYLPTYSDNPRGVLDLLDPRLEGRHPTPTQAVAWLWAAKARAHAALGERVAFRFAIDRARQALDAAPAELSGPGIFSFLPEKLSFYEANGCVWLRDVGGAVRASGQALRSYDLTDTTEPALVRLEQASALAQSGDRSEACRVACAAVLDPHTYYGESVRRRAMRFDRLLGADPTPQIADWREIMTTLDQSEPLVLHG